MIKSEIKIKKIIKLSYTYIMSGLVMLFVCLIIKWIIGASLQTMIIQIIVGAAIYMLMLYFLKDDYLGMFINKAKNIILKKDTKNM